MYSDTGPAALSVSLITSTPSTAIGVSMAERFGDSLPRPDDPIRAGLPRSPFRDIVAPGQVVALSF